MKTEQLNSFSIIGISVKTSNEPGKAEIDIPQLWQQFMSNQVVQKIPNKIDDTIYAVYTHYEGDYTKPYTTVIGCKVTTAASIPDGMIEVVIQQSNYYVHTAKGNLMDGIVFNAWLSIWQMPLKRSYRADFEVYNEKSSNPTNAEIDIFIGIE